MSSLASINFAASAEDVKVCNPCYECLENNHIEIKGYKFCQEIKRWYCQSCVKKHSAFLKSCTLTDAAPDEKVTWNLGEKEPASENEGRNLSVDTTTLPNCSNCDRKADRFCMELFCKAELCEICHKDKHEHHDVKNIDRMRTELKDMVSERIYQSNHNRSQYTKFVKQLEGQLSDAEAKMNQAGQLLCEERDAKIKEIERDYQKVIEQNQVIMSSFKANVTVEINGLKQELETIDAIVMSYDHHMTSFASKRVASWISTDIGETPSPPKEPTKFDIPTFLQRRSEESSASQKTSTTTSVKSPTSSRQPSFSSQEPSKSSKKTPTSKPVAETSDDNKAVGGTELPPGTDLEGLEEVVQSLLGMRPSSSAELRRESPSQFQQERKAAAQQYREVDDTGFVVFCNKDNHRFTMDHCRMCTKCKECTGFGDGCVERKNSRPEPLLNCGCGMGDAGCMDCGICRNCASLQ